MTTAPNPADLPLSLYIHTPWCVRKCPYCDFNSHEQAAIPENAYLAALLDDLASDAHLAQGRKIQSIFIGGGTPSLLSGEFYQRLFDGIRQHLTLAEGIEITMEANPGTVEQGRFDAYRHAGINRLSIGVQSFAAEKLQALGRIHGPEEAIHAMSVARGAGFTNINLDLMHGLPDQTQEQALTDLKTAIELGPEHISWYELTIEPNTAFWSSPPPQPDPDQLAEVEESGFELLLKSGYYRYEISAFSRAGRQCRHNLNYWQFGDYLALGAGAHGKITTPDGQVMRYQKTRLPADYLKQVQRTRQRQALDPDDLRLEFFLNSLRLTRGIDLALYHQRTGLAPAQLAPLLDTLKSRNLLIQENNQVCCTALGLSHLNSVLQVFE